MPWSPRQARFALATLALLCTLLSGALTVAPGAAARPGPESPGVVATYDGGATAFSTSRRRGPATALHRMRRLVNVARAIPQLCGDTLMAAAPPIRRNKRLDRAASKYAQKMARSDWFKHDAPDGTGPGQRITDEDYRWSRWGENIAAGYDVVPTVLAGWLASPGHCRTLMGPYQHVGFGHAYAEGSTYGHYWVQDFASPA